MSIYGVSSFNYTPQAATFTSKPYSGDTKDFEPGLVFPEKEEKKESHVVRNTLIAAAVVATALFLTKGGGKKYVTKAKNFIMNLFKKGSKAAETGAKAATGTAKEAKAAEEVAKEVKVAKPKKVKVKTKKAVVSEQVDLAPNAKVKTKKSGGKEAMHKVRRNKKQIIEQTRLREEAESFTAKDLEAYHASLGTPATAEERAFIQKNNKAATNSMADIMESQGIVRGKASNGRIVLEKPASAPAATAAPKVEIPKADQIADLQAQIAKQDEFIAKYSKPGMERYAKPYQTRKAKLEAELGVLQGKSQKAPKAAPKTQVMTPSVQVTPEAKKAQIEAAWAEFESARPTAAPKTVKVPTADEIWAKAEAEAARVSKEEAEVLRSMSPAA